MQYIQRPECNMVYNAPAGQEDKVGALHVKVHDMEGWHTLTSFWKPSPEELAVLNAGGVVTLNIHAKAHPIVSMGVEA